MNHRRFLIGALIALGASAGCKGKAADGAAPDPSASTGTESDVVEVPEPPPPQDETPTPSPSASAVWYHGYWNLDPDTKAYVWQAGYWQDPTPAAAPAIPPPAPRVETVGPAPWPGYAWNGGYWRWSTHEYLWAPGHWAYGSDVHVPAPPPPRWEEVGGRWTFRDDARVVREESWTHWQAQRDVIREREIIVVQTHPAYNRIYVHTVVARPVVVGRPGAPEHAEEVRHEVAPSVQVHEEINTKVTVEQHGSVGATPPEVPHPGPAGHPSGPSPHNGGGDHGKKP